jgi:hypothetical protein
VASTHADARPSLDCPGSPWIGSIDPRDHCYRYDQYTFDVTVHES